MTTRFTVRNHGKEDAVIVVKENGVDYAHEIPANCETGFDVHAGNSFTVSEKKDEIKVEPKKKS